MYHKIKNNSTVLINSNKINHQQCAYRYYQFGWHRICYFIMCKILSCQGVRVMVINTTFNNISVTPWRKLARKKIRLYMLKINQMANI
jgi:hypothetical protein